MSSLGDALDALERVVGALLPGWNGYQGYRLDVATPAFIVGLPTSVTYNAGTQGRARYEVPITGVADLNRADDLVAFLTGDGLAAELQGSTAAGWWGGLLVTDGGDTRTAPNGAAECIAADVVVQFYA